MNKKKQIEKKNLVIVESPSKAKTINKYLGNNYVVLASKGHLIDLPKSKLGIDVEKGFEPIYIKIRGKASIINELKKAAKNSEKIFIATDPDREGEAIGWHIKNFLSVNANTPPLYRLRLNEITKSAIETAILSPSDVNISMVNAQQARRVLDRLVGYGISPILWKHIRRGLSAGRVQSVALRLVSERELDIKAFKPEEYWSIEADFQTIENQIIHAVLVKINNEKIDIKSQEAATIIKEKIEKASFKVSDIIQKDKIKRSPLPLTTSKLQQEAYKQLRFSAKKTMAVAQGLYEGVEVETGLIGLITYMRTDSQRISPEAKEEARKFIQEIYGPTYIDQTEKSNAKKIKIQDAHESIRPTSVFRTPESIKQYLLPDQFKLYQLIWKAFVASQMSAAQYQVTSVNITGDEFVFRATGTSVAFDGFTKIYQEIIDEDKKNQESEENESDIKIPKVEIDQKLEYQNIFQNQHFTQPPPRYTDASLIKILEELGIGRPSTYAPTLGTLQTRRYIEKNNGRFFLTELGDLIINLLMKNFSNILDYEFTAKLEKELDDVENGREDWHKIIQEFYDPFKNKLQEAEKFFLEQKSIIEQETDIVCEKCGKKMITKWGRHGKFLACSAYPTCQNTKNLKETLDGSLVVEDTHTDEKCPKCGNAMIIRAGRFGKFLACEKYPECKTTKSFTLKIPCPLGCGGEIVVRHAKRGSVFYGCSRYPECRFQSWNKPINRPCPKCGSVFLIEKYNKTQGAYIACPNKECDYHEEPSDASAEKSTE